MLAQKQLGDGAPKNRLAILFVSIQGSGLEL